eukprot:2457079-Amphidinium_carterae.1
MLREQALKQHMGCDIRRGKTELKRNQRPNPSNSMMCVASISTRKKNLQEGWKNTFGIDRKGHRKKQAQNCGGFQQDMSGHFPIMGTLA